MSRDPRRTVASLGLEEHVKASEGQGTIDPAKLLTPPGSNASQPLHPYSPPSYVSAHGTNGAYQGRLPSGPSLALPPALPLAPGCTPSRVSMPGVHGGNTVLHQRTEPSPAGAARSDHAQQPPTFPHLQSVPVKMMDLSQIRVRDDLDVLGLDPDKVKRIVMCAAYALCRKPVVVHDDLGREVGYGVSDLIELVAPSHESDRTPVHMEPDEWSRSAMSIANRHRDLQKVAARRNSRSQHGMTSSPPVYWCTHDCPDASWPASQKGNWKRHEWMHFPQAIWICRGVQCSAKPIEDRPVFKLEDKFKRHYRDKCLPGQISEPHEQDLARCRVDVLGSKFPRECSRCGGEFTTYEDRLEHIAHYFEHDSCPFSSQPTEDVDMEGNQSNEDDEDDASSKSDDEDDRDAPDTHNSDDDPSASGSGTGGALTQSGGSSRFGHGGARSSPSTGQRITYHGTSHWTVYTLAPSSAQAATLRNSAIRRLEKKKVVQKAPSMTGTGSSKVDVFVAKVASAIDQADPSDSEGAFVYDSNPPELPPQPAGRCYHSRTLSATSITNAIVDPARYDSLTNGMARRQMKLLRSLGCHVEIDRTFLSILSAQQKPSVRISFAAGSVEGKYQLQTSNGRGVASSFPFLIYLSSPKQEDPLFLH